MSRNQAGSGAFFGAMDWFVTTWALLAAGFSAVAWARLARPGRARPPLTTWPDVLLLRPVDRPSELERENLRVKVSYPGVLTQVVCSPEPVDEEVQWLPSNPSTQNRKVGHLLGALISVPRREGTVVLSIDADVRVDEALVCSLVEAVRDGAGLATASPRPLGAMTSLPSLSLHGVLVQSHHSFSALDVMQAGAKAVCGKALAFSPAALGVLPALAECIGEDLELSHRLYEQGLEVRLASAPARSPQSPGLRLREVTARFTRWMQVLKAHRPRLFPWVPLLFAPTPVLLALALLFGSAASLLAVALLVLVRTGLAARLDGRERVPFEWLLGEVLLAWCFVAALRAGNTVAWRGRRYLLGASGRMEALGGHS